MLKSATFSNNVWISKSLHRINLHCHLLDEECKKVMLCNNWNYQFQCRWKIACARSTHLLIGSLLHVSLFRIANCLNRINNDTADWRSFLNSFQHRSPDVVKDLERVIRLAYNEALRGTADLDK